MIKKILNKIKTSIWLYPSLYSLIALALSFLTSLIDRFYSSGTHIFAFDFFYTSTNLAQSVLGIVASAFITIATFTFSTTMVVLTMYSSQFTPRVVENFLNNETTMKSFGIFLSGFIYAITSLLFLNINQSGNLVIAASVAVVYVIVGLIYFLVFIHNVSTYIQANGLILRLQKEAQGKIGTYCNQVHQANIISDRPLEKIIEGKTKSIITSDDDGYIQEIDTIRLQKIAQLHGLIIRINKVVGQFVSTESRMITVFSEAPQQLKLEIAREIKHCIWIGNKKTESQDFAFTIQKIVEIALRALSPGINDPYTAIHCSKIIGVLLRELANVDKGYIVLRDENTSGFVVYEAYDFEIILFDAFHQIVLYGQTDARVVMGIFKSLKIIAGKASVTNLEVIKEYAEIVYNKLPRDRYDVLEYKKITREFRQLLNEDVNKLNA